MKSVFRYCVQQKLHTVLHGFIWQLANFLNCDGALATEQQGHSCVGGAGCVAEETSVMVDLEDEVG